MANIRDFAVAEVLTAPSPATTGTTLVLKTGQGADMPTTVPYKLTLFPKGVMPTKSNSEVVLVTAQSTDTLTIVRAQGEATAKTVLTDWLVTNALYASDIFTGGLVLDEQLTGTINGTNKVFTTSQNFTSIDLRKNGLALHLGSGFDFTITGANQITFVTAPTSGIVTGSYMIGGQIQIAGTSSQVVKEAVTGTPNGTIVLFTTLRPYIGGSLEVYINGVNEGNKVVETNPSLGTFTLDTAPITGTDIQVSYQFASGTLGNADTVDGIHASTTATASKLFPLNSNARIASSLLENPYKFSVYLAGTQNDGNGAFAITLFDTKVFDTGSNLDIVTNKGRFTAPVDGFYYFNAASNSLVTASTYYLISLFKNGTEEVRGQQNYGTGANISKTVAGLIQLAAGDYVDVRTYATNGLLQAGKVNTYFHGFLMSKA